MVIDGLPVGEAIDMEQVQQFMERRAPGRNAYSTPRKEGDVPRVVSGLFEGKTCGAPICAIIENTNTRSKDYDKLKDLPRPGHADFTAWVKYDGCNDHRGGGHFSGRLTAPLCFAGAVCKQILERKGIHIGAHIYSVADIGDDGFDPVSLTLADLDTLHTHTFPVINEEKGAKMRAAIEEARLDADSVGGVVECGAIGLPAGLGEHMFMGVEGRISSIVFAIPAVKGVEFGLGFGSAALRGSQNNDPFVTDGKTITTKTNNCGGILGGMTDGMPLIFRAAMKPTPSIGKEQDSVSISRRENVKLTVVGRHDPCILPRAVPVFEAACALSIMDMILD